MNQAIGAGEPMEQLKILHLEAVRLELPIPDALEHKYRQAMEGEKTRRSESRRSYLLAIALAALVALALGGLIVVIVITSARK